MGLTRILALSFLDGMNPLTALFGRVTRPNSGMNLIEPDPPDLEEYIAQMEEADPPKVHTAPEPETRDTLVTKRREQIRAMRQAKNDWCDRIKHVTTSSSVVLQTGDSQSVLLDLKKSVGATDSDWKTLIQKLHALILLSGDKYPEKNLIDVIARLTPHEKQMLLQSVMLGLTYSFGGSSHPLDVWEARVKTQATEKSGSSKKGESHTTKHDW